MLDINNARKSPYHCSRNLKSGLIDKSLLTVPPKTALGTALAYTVNQWHKVIRYTEDGRLSIDNNRAERAIKPFVIVLNIGHLLLRIMAKQWQTLLEKQLRSAEQLCHRED